MRSLVTGGAGFIGSHLCEALLGRGHQVTCLDNLVTGRAQNLAHLEGRPGFSFVEADVCQLTSLEGPVDFVYHLASLASPVDFASKPLEILDVGTLGTRRALELALAKGARLLLASTSEVYGDPLVHPQPESYWGNVNPVGPRGCYDESKRAAEAYCMAYHRRHGLETRIVRIFNTYGPRMRLDDGRAIPNFMVQALRGDRMTVYGDGSQTRSICYVSDMVAGLMAVAEGPDPMPINIGTQFEVTMLDLANMVRELAGAAVEVEFRRLPEDDPRQRRPDTTRARDLLGWQPQVSIDDGLRLTMDYFRSIL